MQNNLVFLLKEVFIVKSDLEKFCKSMPNIKFPTLGGLLVWEDIHEIEGWRVQQNTLTGHYRILDDEDIRRAWGFSEEYMIKKIQQFVDANK